MNRSKKYILFTLLILLISAGCSSSAEENTGKISAYATFTAMYDFTSKIGGGKADVKQLVPAGQEPHEWEPTARAITQISKSEIVIYNGHGMEGFIDKIKDTSKALFVEASSGIEAAESDPHVWLNPLYAKKELENIKNGFISIDPDNESYYNQNYSYYAEKLDDLDHRYKNSLSGVKNKTIIVAHEAYGYLCAAYGLTQEPLAGLGGDSEPTPSRLAEIIGFINENNIRYIFFEELSSSKVIDTITKETGALPLALNPFEALTDEEELAGADYFTVMEQNLSNLVKALE